MKRKLKFKPKWTWYQTIMSGYIIAMIISYFEDTTLLSIKATIFIFLGMTILTSFEYKNKEGSLK